MRDSVDFHIVPSCLSVVYEIHIDLLYSLILCPSGCREELEKVRRDYLEEEAKRLEKEEEMWSTHEAHRNEIEVERRHLADLLNEHEQKRAEAEAELDQFRRGIKPGECAL